MNHWFDLVSSWHPVMALSKMHPNKHAEAVQFLLGVIKIFRSMSVGSKGEWKPIQMGVILSTTSVLDIQEELLDKGHKFLLKLRLTQVNYGKFAVTPCKQILSLSVCGSEKNWGSLDISNSVLCSSSDCELQLLQLI